ncbi:MAG: hypothetical protein K2X47_20095 [Bdellovibrionales bacterium]|nr:hypothetical protein [Bdellovibrionales bacterium]
MKLSFIPMIFVFTAALSANAVEKPKLVPVPLTAAFVPQGFDSNDKAQVMVEGYLPSACYKIGPTEAVVDEKTGTIRVQQMAYYHNVMCAQAIIPYNQVIQVGILGQGNYKVQDVRSGDILGALPIRLATQAEPDEYLYASVRDAYVLPEGAGPRVARVEGFFSNTCSRIKEMKMVEESDTVIAILPIVERRPGTACNRMLVPFQEDVRLPHLNVGRHLLHVRSLSGQAVNKLFDVYPSERR